MFLGYIIAVIALLGFKNVTLTTLLAPICLLAIPIMDTAFAILRRIINKKPIDEPDKDHLHHQLLNKMHLSHKATVLVIYGIDLLFALAMLTYIFYDNTVGVIIYAILFIAVLIFIMKTNIIINHDKK
jgi:UDP-GlcNAc:undecaprenyl-phosphate GlcNAc-1-phosphate transferase